MDDSTSDATANGLVGAQLEVKIEEEVGVDSGNNIIPLEGHNNTLDINNNELHIEEGTSEKREEEPPKKSRKRSNKKTEVPLPTESTRTLRPRKKINYTESKYSDYEVFSKKGNKENTTEEEEENGVWSSRVKKTSSPSQSNSNNNNDEEDEKTKELAKYYVIKKQYRSSFSGGVEEGGLFPDFISKIELKYLAGEKFQVHSNDHSMGDIEKGFISNDCYLQLRNLLISLFYRTKTSYLSIPRCLKFIDVCLFINSSLYFLFTSY